MSYKIYLIKVSMTKIIPKEDIRQANDVKCAIGLKEANG